MTPFLLLGLTLATTPPGAAPAPDGGSVEYDSRPDQVSSERDSAEARPPERDSAQTRPPVLSHGDLFPPAGHVTTAAATGLPFYAIGEAGFAFGDGVALGVIGGRTPSVWTFGIRPRFRVAMGPRTSLVLVVPMLYYPKASAPGPGNVGATTWVLARPELFFDGAIGNRWHVAGGMGIVAAAATEALAESLAGKQFAMPPYNGTGDRRQGFAGGIWNTVCARTSVALDRQTNLFLESSLVLNGWMPADNVGGPPIVVTVGASHVF
jgi:hypothetical protein